MTAINDEFLEDIVKRVQELDKQYVKDMHEQMKGRIAGQREMTDDELFVAVQNKSRKWAAQGDPNFLSALAIASPKTYRQFERAWMRNMAATAYMAPMEVFDGT